MEKPDVIFLDWDGTLSISRFWQALEAESPPRAQTIKTVLFGDDKTLVKQWMRGDHTAESICELLAEHSKTTADVWLDELRSSCQAMVLIDPGILRLVDQIRRSIPVVLATDNMDTFTRWTVPALGLERHFDDVLNSYDRRLFKIDRNKDGTRRFFHDHMRSRNYRQALLIDDSADVATLKGPGFEVATIVRGSSGATAVLRRILAL